MADDIYAQGFGIVCKALKAKRCFQSCQNRYRNTLCQRSQCFQKRVDSVCSVREPNDRRRGVFLERLFEGQCSIRYAAVGKVLDLALGVSQALAAELSGTNA